MPTTEPVAASAAISNAVRVVVAALILFGVLHWSGEQVAGFVLAVSTVLDLPLTLRARSKVTPNVNVLTERAGSSAGRKPPTLIGGPVQLTQPWPDDEAGR